MSQDPAQAAAERVKGLESDKVRLISRYMELQDAADEMNRRIYEVCVEIETLNLKIEVEKEKEMLRLAAVARATKAAVEGKTSGNGNGNGNGSHPKPAK